MREFMPPAQTSFRFGEQSEPAIPARKADTSERPPQAIFVSPPGIADLAFLEEAYDGKNKAYEKFRRYLQEVFPKPVDSQERIALVDYLYVLRTVTRREELRAKTTLSDTNGDLLVQAEKQARQATQEQIEHGMHYEFKAHSSKNPYNKTILKLVELGDRLTHIESDIIRFPYMGIMGKDFQGVKTVEEKAAHPDLPTANQIRAQALGIVFTNVRRIYNDIFLTPRKRA